MSATDIVLMIISVISSIASIVFAYLAFSRNKTKDTRQEATDFTSMRVDLMYIKDGVNDLKKEINSQHTLNSEFDKRLTLLEEKIETHIKDKSLHAHYQKKGN